MKIHDVCVNCCEQFKSNLIVREIIIDSTLRSSSSSTATSSSSGRASSKWKSVRVNQVLSSVYKFGLMDQLPFKNRVYGGPNDDDDDAELAVCGDCARTLTNLYHYFEEFNRMRKTQSYISNKMNKFNKTWTHLAKGVPPPPPPLDNDRLALSIYDDDYDDMSPHHNENGASNNNNESGVETPAANEEEPHRRNRLVKVERETDPDIEIIDIIDIMAPRPPSLTPATNSHNSVVNHHQHENTESNDPLERQNNNNNNNNGFDFEDPPSNLIEFSNGSANPVQDFFPEDDEMDPLAISENQGDDDDDADAAAAGDQDDGGGGDGGGEEVEYDDGRACTLCNEVYLTSSDLAKHLFQAHVEKGDKHCPICDKQYSLGYMETHLRLHAGYKPFSCPASGCRMTFISSSNLYKHLQSGHQGAKNAGRTRKTIFGSKSFKGKAKGIPKNVVQSSSSSTTTTTKTTTTTTMKSQTTPFKSNCPLCSLDHFKTPDQLGTHIFRDHIPGNSATCPVCQMVVIHRGPMKMHILRKHAGGFHGDIRVKKKSKPSNGIVKKKFITSRRQDRLCPYCAKPCQSDSALVMHIRIHTGEKPFKCADCDYAASRLYTLNIHCSNNNHRPADE